MGTPERLPDAPLDQRARLVEEARRCGFFPLVQLLERLTGGAPVGTSASPSGDRIRFRHDPALAFSTADVVAVRETALPPEPSDAEGSPRRGFEVTTSFLGLTGGVTPLPLYLAEEVCQEDPDAPLLGAFLDLFHHRLLSFLYRARAKYDVPAGWRSDLSDPWSPRLLALLGIDASQESAPGAPARWWLLRLAPLLAEGAVTAHALEAALTDALAPDLGGARVAVEPFAGTWADISRDDRNRLGQRSCRLGLDLVLGRRVFDVAGRFRVLIGPLSSEGYRRFAAGEPVGRAEGVIGALVSEPIEHEIVLWLAEDAAPALALGASRLGKDSWLGGQRRQMRIRAHQA